MNNPHARVLTAVLLFQGLLFYSASHGDAVPLKQPLDRFPNTIGEWTTRQVGVVDQETLDILKADDTMSRDYALHDQVVNLWVAYFKTQRTGQSPHSPKNCLPGSGWSQVAAGYLDVPIPSRNETIRINRYLVSKGGDKGLTLYWYQSGRRVIANEFDAKFWLVADSVRLHRSDTAVVKVVIPVFQDQDQKAEAAGIGFVQAVYPALRDFMPL